MLAGMRRSLVTGGAVLLAGACAGAVAFETTRPGGSAPSVAPTAAGSSPQTRPMTLREFQAAAKAFAASLNRSLNAPPPTYPSAQPGRSALHVPPVLLLFEP
jgi:hypothetical protein